MPTGDCQEIKSEQVRLALTASNLANVNSTRTPEGGPYRAYIIKSCSNGGCDVTRDNRAPLMKFLPDHPDADKNGYVAYPNIDQKSEYALFSMTAIKLKLLAKNRTCGIKISLDNGNSSFAIRYGGHGQPNVKEDIFNVSPKGQVVSWMRQDVNGLATTLNFDENGEASSF
jgi:hypothetical protein